MSQKKVVVGEHRVNHRRTPRGSQPPLDMVDTSDTEVQTQAERSARQAGLANLSEEEARKTLDAMDSGDLFREFMRRFGVDVNDEHFQGTPARVIRMYQEILVGYKKPKWSFTTFNASEHPSLVTVANIKYYSLCSHHLCPFWGSAHVAYLPDKKIVGLSKLARTVRHFAAKLQVQERLTEEIADFLDERLKPRALAVMMTAEHLCMSMRGVRTPHAETTTSQMRGSFITDVGLKAEFFKIIDISKK